jgi:5-oxoprolinase (ATP-hydrolysing) subunit B
MNPRFHLCGTGAVLMDVSAGPFGLDTQQRLWSLAARAGALGQLAGVRSVVLGVNNVLVTFDALQVHARDLQDALAAAWSAAQPTTEPGRLLDIPVAYDTAPGSELEDIARRLGLVVAEVVRLHTSVEYRVACIGSVPGFPYLVGLPAELALPRLQTPRARVPKGSVAIGGAQTGVMPMDMPSGWNVLGRTELALFDPLRAEPSLLAPGDRVRFSAREAVR